MPSAAPLTLLSNSPYTSFTIILVAFGTALFVIGAFLVRREEPLARPRPKPKTEPANALVLLDSQPEPHVEAPAEPLLAAKTGKVTWTRAFGDEGKLDYTTRIDMIERLAMIGEPWCIDALEQALHEERDARVHKAAENALLVIKSR